MTTTGPILIHTANGRFADDGRAQFDRLVAALEAADEPRLLVHVHGGLVSKAKGDEIASDLDKACAYGPLHAEGWTTAYFIWESSVREAIRNNQDELASQPLLLRYILALAAWIMGDGKLLQADTDEALRLAMEYLDRTDPPDLGPIGDDLDKAQGVDALAEDQLLDTRLAERLRADPELRRLHAKVEAAAVEGGEAADLDTPVLERVRARRTIGSKMDTKGMGAAELALIPLLVAAGFRVIVRLLRGRDHGAYCTIVEEVLRAVYLAKCGAQAWTLMKQDTADHFAKDAPGDLLLSQLISMAEDGKPVRVLFVGHSAGAVMASYFANATPRLPQGLTLDYALLAPAVRMDLAADLLTVRPRGLDHMRVFTMDDERERRDNLDDTPFGKLYPRSLLYLIAGVLEETSQHGSYADAPLVGLQRHLQGDRGLNKKERKARSLMGTLLKGDVVYAGQDGGPGRQCETHTHGTIDHDGATLASLRWLARSGYDLAPADERSPPA